MSEITEVSFSMTDLRGKIALVSGASRGIGEAAARALDAAGAQVVLSGRTTSDLERVAGELTHSPLVVTADLSLAGAGAALAIDVLSVVDGVDIVVNNAGIPMRRMPEQLTEEDVDLVYAINVRALLMLTIGLGESMKSRGGGSVINISSVAGIRGPAGRAAYAATKGAVDALTRALASDWGPEGIRVNSIEESRQTIPGLIEDMEGQIALKRWGFSDDIADVILFFAGNDSRYVTGETLVVDGGLAKVGASAKPQLLPEMSAE